MRFTYVMHADYSQLIFSSPPSGIHASAHNVWQRMTRIKNDSLSAESKSQQELLFISSDASPCQDLVLSQDNFQITPDRSLYTTLGLVLHNELSPPITNLLQVSLLPALGGSRHFIYRNHLNAFSVFSRIVSRLNYSKWLQADLPQYTIWPRCLIQSAAA